MPSRPCPSPSATAVLLAALLLGGCAGDDGPAAPEEGPFAIHVRVATEKGEPVAGLRGALSPDLGPDVVRWPYAKARDLPPAGEELTLRVYDLEDRLIRTLVRSGPSHFVIWDGRDEEGGTVHDGVYRYVSESLGPDDRVVTTVYHGFFIAGDPDFHAAGETDAEGRFSVWDRTYVPALYDLDPIEVITYPDNAVAWIEPTLRTRLTLLADDGSYQVVVFDAVDKGQDVSVTWDPQPAATGTSR